MFATFILNRKRNAAYTGAGSAKDTVSQVMKNPPPAVINDVATMIKHKAKSSSTSDIRWEFDKWVQSAQAPRELREAVKGKLGL